MDANRLYGEALAETRALLETMARQGQRTLSVPPEVLELLDAAQARGLGLAVEAAPGPEMREAVETVEALVVAKEDSVPEPEADEAEEPVPDGGIQTLYQLAGAGAGDREEALQALAAEAARCARCGLHETRQQVVFGVGNPNAEIVFVGEAPGEQEDRQGVPFVGRAGQLLTDIIEKGMQIPRHEVYICNVLKCRPPGNRTPSPDEMLMCEGFLLKQIEIIEPRLIVALGKTAAQCLLRSDDAVGRLRGVWHDYHGVPLRVTYHPSYLLRNPGDKRLVWEDIKEVLRYLNEQG